MFLLDDARCNEDYDGVVNRVKTILTNHAAEVVSCEKWDQRRLCYPIKHRQRATYLLVHFNAPEGSIAALRASCYLAQEILRVLILVDEDKGAPPAPRTEEGEARETAPTQESVARDAAPAGEPSELQEIPIPMDEEDEDSEELAEESEKAE